MGEGNVSGKAGQLTQITAIIDLSRFSKRRSITGARLTRFVKPFLVTGKSPSSH